jgi:hypothetical protein
LFSFSATAALGLVRSRRHARPAVGERDTESYVRLCEPLSVLVTYSSWFWEVVDF